MGGLIAGQLSMTLEMAVLAGIAVFLLFVAGLIAWRRREANAYITRVMDSRGIGPKASRHSSG